MTSSTPGKLIKTKKELHSIVVCQHGNVEVQALKSIGTKKLIRYVRPVGKIVDGGAKVKKEPELQSLGHVRSFK
jgi:hypothetical protein